jgi:hypothetical protein
LEAVSSICNLRTRHAVHVFDKFPKYNMKILLGDLNAKVDKKDISNQQLGMSVYMNLLMTMEL